MKEYFFEKINIKHYLFSTSIIATLSMSGALQAHEEHAAMMQQDTFKVSGFFASYTKVGFNKKSKGGEIDPGYSNPGDYTDNDRANGSKIYTLYPTDTYSTSFNQLDATYEFDTGDSKITSGLGASIGGLVKVSSEYGSYYYYNNFIIHNAFVKYDGKHVSALLGRHSSDHDYISAYIEGIDLSFHTNYGDENPLNEVALKLFAAFKRGYAYTSYIYDYYELTKGIYEIGLKLSNGHMNDGEGSSILAYPSFYISPSKAYAPTLKVQYKKYQNLENGVNFGSETSFDSFYVYADESQRGVYKYGQKIGKTAANITLDQKFVFDNTYTGLGIYKNMGNAYASLDTGSPTVLSMWTSTVYEIGRTLSSVGSGNALTSYAYAGADYKQNLGTLSVLVRGRYTTSPRSNESGVLLDLGYSFNNGVAINSRLHYLTVTTNPGYAVGWNGPTLLNKKDKDTQDRTYAYLEVSYSF